jgi:hypothetical protein
VSASGYPTMPVLNTTSPAMDFLAPKEWPVYCSPSARSSVIFAISGRETSIRVFFAGDEP